jgi:glycosyltransferase involved in cell wall biosynthesis
MAIAPGPLPGQVVGVRIDPQRVRFEGWAALPSNDIQSVFVTIDGIVRAHADIWFPTPPGSATEAVSAGWRATLDRSEIELGIHSIGGLVLRGYGLVEVLDPIDVEFAPPMERPGDVNDPKNGETVTDFVQVRGWFLTGHGYDRVEVRLAGGKPVPARLLASPRPELVNQVADPDAPLAGWELLLSLDSHRSVDGKEGGDDDDIPEHHQDHGIEPIEKGSIRVIVDAIGPRGHIRLGDRIVKREPHPALKQSQVKLAAAIAARTKRTTADYTPDGTGLNLLVATHDLGLGGGQLYVQELLRHLLRESDVRCTVLSASDGVLWSELEQLGARVHIVGNAPSAAPRYEDWINQKARIVADSGANAVLANTAASYWGVDLAARLGVPSAWAIHESFAPEIFLHVGFHYPPDAHVRRRFLGAFGQAGAVVFEADATKRIFRDVIPKGRGVRVDYGIDLERIHSFVAENPREDIREALDVKHDQILVMCMGTYEPRKAQALLTAAFARVADDFPRAVLAMVGDKGGPYSEGVHDLVKNFDLTERVRLVPVTPDIDDWYLAADAFILASDIESLPRSMLEVMAFGTPVLAPAVFGVSEVVEDGINGLLFDPTSVASAAEVLRRFLQIPRARRKEMGEAGRLTVEANRSSANYARDYRALFAALASEREPDLEAALKATTA